MRRRGREGEGCSKEKKKGDALHGDASYTPAAQGSICQTLAAITFRRPATFALWCVELGFELGYSGIRCVIVGLDDRPNSISLGG